MDQDHRMECLRMAFELGGKTEPIVSAARQLLDFLHGREEQLAEANPEPTLAETLAVEATVTPETAPPVASETIAACGTAMLIPEGGELADAVPNVEASQGSPPEAVPQQEAAAGEGDTVLGDQEASASNHSEASATAVSEATSPPADAVPAASGDATEQPTLETKSVEAANDAETALCVEGVDAVAAEHTQAPQSAVAEDAVALAAAL
jgi:hypothetical protein